ncbi:MAG: GNAT family N-acetyltransferase [Solirubrobacterales bacterium]
MEHPKQEVSIERVRVVDLPLLMPMLRAYCDFYEVDPRDDRLVALCRALIDDPGEGTQLLARRIEEDGAIGDPLGFATVFWTWQTLDAARIGVMNDLFVVADARGTGVGRRLIEACRGECRKRGAQKLVWETALDNERAQALYDSMGAESSRWLSYEIDAW